MLLENLGAEYYRLNFLVDVQNSHIQQEMEVSLQAGEIVGVLCDALLKQYKNPESPETLKSLNALCVRLVFCLYAEDAGIFGKRNMFHDYLNAHRTEDRLALIQLFRVLDQKPEKRDPYLSDDLLAFPYVNGGLFADENIEIPRLGDEVLDLILKRASADFDWSAISPTIFGAVFESTLNPETRRSGGMHYTSLVYFLRTKIDRLWMSHIKSKGCLQTINASDDNPSVCSAMRFLLTIDYKYCIFKCRKDGIMMAYSVDLRMKAVEHYLGSRCRGFSRALTPTLDAYFTGANSAIMPRITKPIISRDTVSSAGGGNQQYLR